VDHYTHRAAQLRFPGLSSAPISIFPVHLLRIHRPAPLRRICVWLEPLGMGTRTQCGSSSSAGPWILHSALDCVPCNLRSPASACITSVPASGICSFFYFFRVRSVAPLLAVYADLMRCPCDGLL
jgi:hypothetical protein